MKDHPGIHEFKDCISHMCLAGAVVTCWVITQDVGRKRRRQKSFYRFCKFFTIHLGKCYDRIHAPFPLFVLGVILLFLCTFLHLMFGYIYRLFPNVLNGIYFGLFNLSFLFVFTSRIQIQFWLKMYIPYVMVFLLLSLLNDAFIQTIRLDYPPMKGTLHGCV